MGVKEELVFKILDYLNKTEVRATYGAVAEVLEYCLALLDSSF